MFKRPSDPNQHAKLTVELATGQAQEEKPKGRQLSGLASAAGMSAQQRHKRAKKAATVRWGKKNKSA